MIQLDNNSIYFNNVNEVKSGYSISLTDNTYNIIFKTNNVEIMTIANNGNVGVGITSPNYNLDVYGNINASNIFIKGKNIFTITNETSNYIAYTSNILVGSIIDTSNYVPYTSNIFLGRIIDTSNYVSMTSNIFLGRINETSNYVPYTSNILVGRINDTSNYVPYTSNIMVGRINDTSNYVPYTSNILVGRLIDTSNYVVYTSNIFLGRIIDTSNYVSMTSNIFLGSINETSNYVPYTSNILVGRLIDTSNYVRITSNILVGCINDTSNYVAYTSNILVGRIIDTSNYVAYTSDILVGHIIDTSNYVVYASDIFAGIIDVNNLEYSINDTSNYVAYTSNILVGRIIDTSNYVAYTSNILVGHIIDTSNYVRITSNILIGRINDTSNYVRDTSNILAGRIIDTSNYVRITSNILVGRIIDTSNYVAYTSDILVGRIIDTSNYVVYTSNIFVGRINDTSNYVGITSYILAKRIESLFFEAMLGEQSSLYQKKIDDTSNYVAYTSNILVGRINETSNYVPYTSNILVGRINDTSNYVPYTSNILVGRINDTSNYVRITSNILVGRIIDTSNYIGNTSNILIGRIIDTSNYVRDTSNILVGRIIDTSNYIAYTSNILVARINNTSNYVRDTSNILVGQESSNYIRYTSNILIGRIVESSNYIRDTSNILVGRIVEARNYIITTIHESKIVGRIKDTSNYIRDTSNILIGRIVESSNYIRDTSNILVGRIKDTSNYIRDTSNILIGRIKDTSNYIRYTSNILIGRIKDTSNASNMLEGRIKNTSNYIRETSNILVSNININPWISSNNIIYYNTSNVGIGTYNPISKLHICDNSTILTIQNVETNIICGIKKYPETPSTNADSWTDNGFSVVCKTSDPFFSYYSLLYYLFNNSIGDLYYSDAVFNGGDLYNYLGDTMFKGTNGIVLYIDLGRSIILRGMRITPYETYLSGAPGIFKIYASNDSASWTDTNHGSWTEIHSQTTSLTFSISQSTEFGNFSTINTPYRYFTMVVYNLRGPYQYLIMSEWDIFGTYVITPVVIDNGYQYLKFKHSGGSERQTLYTISVPEGGVFCDILMVGGGGAGGSFLGGGGGGGAVLHGTNINIPSGSYDIYVGNGAKWVNNNERRDSGSTTGFGATILGGGSGSFWIADSLYAISASSGGSGGGLGYVGGSALGAGGVVQSTLGTILNNAILYHGNQGGGIGDYTTWGGFNIFAGGGGAQITSGLNGGRLRLVPITSVGNGGNGVSINITGTEYYWGAGGGGSYYLGEEGVLFDTYANLSGNGGLGGGGAGWDSFRQNIHGKRGEHGMGDYTTQITDGINGTGSGGGAGLHSVQNFYPGSGGSGIIIIKFKMETTSTPTSSIELLRGTTGDLSTHYSIGNYNNNLKIISSVMGIPTDRLVINSNGNVGIGTSNPSYMLEVSDTTIYTYTLPPNITTNLIAWYKLNDNMYDSTGITGTLTAPFLPLVYGHTAIDSNLPIAHYTVHQGSDNYAYTQPKYIALISSIAFWFRIIDELPNNLMMYISDSFGKIYFTISKVTPATTPATFKFKVSISNSNSPNVVSATMVSSNLVFLNTWYFAVVVITSSTINLYLNGVLSGPPLLASSISLTKQFIGTLTRIDIGSLFNGNLADIKIYNKELSLPEIMTLLNYGDNTTIYTDTLPPNITTNLIAWYKLNGNMYDSTGITGTLIGLQGELVYNQDTSIDSNLPYAYYTVNGGASDNFASTPVMTKTLPYSIAFWIRITGYIYAYIYPFAITGSFKFRVIGKSSNYTLLTCSIITYNVDGTQEGYINSPTDLVLNTWCFVVVTITNSTINLYLNGVLTATLLASSISYTMQFSGITEMKNIAGSLTHFNGNFADIKIYNKELSSSEIMTLLSLSYGGVTTINAIKLADTSPFNITNLIAWYKLDGNMIDSSGITGPLIAQGGALVYEQDPSIDSNLPYAHYTVHPVNNIYTYAITPVMTTALPYSFAFWVRPTGVSTTENFYGIMKFNKFDLIIYKFPNSNKFRFTILGSSNVIVSQSTDDVILYNVWCFVVVVITTSTIKTYLNGILNNNVSNNVSNNVIGDISSIIYIGAGTHSGLSGNLADIKIYNKELSLAEITTLFNFSQLLFTQISPYSKSPTPDPKICAKFNSSIWTVGNVYTTSDLRIKEDIQDINHDSSLQMILAIKPITYKYIDRIDNGDNKAFGFIAQQVQKVIPEAVSIEKSYIPNIMMIADYYNNIITLPYKPTKTTIIIKDKIKCYDSDNKMIEFEISKVINEVSFMIKGLDKKYKNNKIFVYGTYVNDLHILSKEHIFTLNVSATQELYRQIKVHDNIIKSRERIKALEDANIVLNKKYERLLKELTLINQNNN